MIFLLVLAPFHRTSGDGGALEEFGSAQWMHSDGCSIGIRSICLSLNKRALAISRLFSLVLYDKVQDRLWLQSRLFLENVATNPSSKECSGLHPGNRG